MTHRDIADNNILHPPLVYLFESQTAGIHESAISERDVTIAAIRLRAELKTSANPSHGFGLIGAVEQRATLEACDITVADGDMLAKHRLLQSIA